MATWAFTSPAPELKDWKKAWKDLKFFISTQHTRHNAYLLCASLWLLTVLLLSVTVSDGVDFGFFALFGSLHIFENGGSPADLKESKTEQLLLSENMQM